MLGRDEEWLVKEVEDRFQKKGVRVPATAEIAIEALRSCVPKPKLAELVAKAREAGLSSLDTVLSWNKRLGPANHRAVSVKAGNLMLRNVAEAVVAVALHQGILMEREQFAATI